MAFMSGLRCGLCFVVFGMTWTQSQSPLKVLDKPVRTVLLVRFASVRPAPAVLMEVAVDSAILSQSLGRGRMR